MTSNVEPTEDNKASRMMRNAILRELQCPPGAPDDPPPADNLEQVARSPRAQGRAGRRRGDQGSPRPHRRQDPAGRARKG
jgi:hypothetical protein